MNDPRSSSPGYPPAGAAYPPAGAAYPPAGNQYWPAQPDPLAYRSPRQWEAYVRDRLGRHVPVAAVLAEMAAAGANPATSYGYVQTQLAYLRRRAWLYLGSSVAIAVVGGLLAFGLNDGTRSGSSASSYGVTLAVVGVAAAVVTLYRLVRLPRP